MELVINTLGSLAYIIVEPSLLIMLVLVSSIFYFKNRKIVAMQRMVIGEEINSPLELTLSQIVFGLLAGIIGSIILSSIGVIFTNNSGIIYLFILSIVLMFFKPRFVCFSYSGAVLGTISIVYYYIAGFFSLDRSLFHIDITTLMTFIGVLHIVEALLVVVDGEKGTIPVFSNRNNKIVGGYAFSRYWILPISIFIAVKLGINDQVLTDSIQTPSWWPIMTNEYVLTILATMVLTMTPLFGVIGYSSVSFTKSKKKKVISSSFYIFTFGVVLILVAQLADFGVIGQIVAIVFAPVGHELMLRIQRHIEDRGTPIYISGEDGISVLEVVPYSEIYDLGIRSGDKIIRLNGERVSSERQIYDSAKNKINGLVIQAKSISGNLKEITLKGNGTDRLGVLLVPRVVDSDKVVPLDENNFSDVLNKISKKINNDSNKRSN